MIRFPFHSYAECRQEAEELADKLFRVSQVGNLRDDMQMRKRLHATALSVIGHILGSRNRIRLLESRRALRKAEVSIWKLRMQIQLSRELGYLSEGDYLDLEDSVSRIFYGLNRMLPGKPRLQCFHKN